MGRKHSRKHKPRSLPYASPDEKVRGRSWVVAGHRITNQAVALAVLADIERLKRAALRGDGPADLQVILASVSWPEDEP